jgi:hypothetical protein
LQAKCGGTNSKQGSSSDNNMMMVDNSNPQQAGEQEEETPSKNINKESIRQTAKTLEQLLFQQSQQSINLYQDISTLDARLRDLMTVLLRRRMMKRTGRDSNKAGRAALQSKAMRRLSPNSPTTKKQHQQQPQQKQQETSSKLSTRDQFLMRLLGKPKYLEISKLLQEIRLAKLKKVATFCGSQSCTATPMLLLCGKTFDTQLPKVVRQLYFETPLVDCFERYSLERLQQLPWKDLVHQAQSNLLAYQLWEMQL